MNMFAVKDDVVRTYHVDVNVRNITIVQQEIDKWSGKGELQETEASDLLHLHMPGRKIEIVSSKYIGKGTVFSSCCAEADTVDMYKFKYYDYKQHQLSMMCDKFLGNCSQLDFSRFIAELLEWESDDLEERRLVQLLLSSFKFKSIGTEDIVKSDLTIDEKRGLLRRLKDAVKNISYPRSIIVSSNEYKEAVEEEIRGRETFNTGFYSRELNGKDFKFSSEEKTKIKRELVLSLPKVDAIKKCY